MSTNDLDQAWQTFRTATVGEIALAMGAFSTMIAPFTLYLFLYQPQDFESLSIAKIIILSLAFSAPTFVVNTFLIIFAAVLAKWIWRFCKRRSLECGEKIDHLLGNAAWFAACITFSFLTIPIVFEKWSNPHKPFSVEELNVGYGFAVVEAIVVTISCIGVLIADNQNSNVGSSLDEETVTPQCTSQTPEP